MTQVFAPEYRGAGILLHVTSLSSRTVSVILITPAVQALRDQFQVPGTRILQFVFDGHTDNPYLPHNFVPNTVVYTGTHDNATTRQWYEELPEFQRQNCGVTSSTRQARVQKQRRH